MPLKLTEGKKNADPDFRGGVVRNSSTKEAAVTPQWIFSSFYSGQTVRHLVFAYVTGWSILFCLVIWWQFVFCVEVMILAVPPLKKRPVEHKRSLSLTQQDGLLWTLCGVRGMKMLRGSISFFVRKKRQSAWSQSRVPSEAGPTGRDIFALRKKSSGKGKGATPNNKDCNLHLRFFLFWVGV